MRISAIGLSDILAKPYPVCRALLGQILVAELARGWHVLQTSPISGYWQGAEGFPSMNCRVTSSTDQVMACSHSPQLAVFFSDDSGFGIELVQALDAAHAQDIARALHRRAAWPPPFELRFGPVAAEDLTSLAGMQSC